MIVRTGVINMMWGRMFFAMIMGILTAAFLIDGQFNMAIFTAIICAITIYTMRGGKREKNGRV